MTFKTSYLAILFSFIAITGCSGGGGNDESTSEGTKENTQSAVINAINISGEWAEGETLIATVNCTECLPSLNKYIWSIDGKNISNTDSYLLTFADLDKKIRIDASSNNNLNLIDNRERI